MKRGPRALALSGGVLALAVVAMLAAEWSGWRFLRQPIQAALARSTGVPVLMEGNFRAHLLWRPRLVIDRLQLGAAHSLPVPHLMDARGVELGWRWLDLWRWQRGGVLRVQHLSAASLDANLVRNAAGRASWQLGTKKAPDDAASDAQQPLAELPRFGLLELRQAHIDVDDAPSKTQIRIEVRGGEGDDLRKVPHTPEHDPARTAAAASSASAVGGGVAAPVTRAGYEARVVGRWQALPLRLQVQTAGSLPMFQDALSDDDADASRVAVPVRVEGVAGAARLLFEGTASALLGDRVLQGALRFSGPSLARVGQPLAITLPHTPPFELRGQVSHNAGVWQLRAEKVTMGRSLLNGEFRFDTRATPPLLSGRLGGQRLALADLGPAVGAQTGATAPGAAASAAVATAPATSAGGRVLPQRRFDLPSLRVMDADVQVAIAELDFGSDALSALRDLKTHLLLKNGVLQLQSLQAVVAGGKFAGNTQLDANTQPARWGADMRFTTVDVAGWLQGLRAAGGRAETPAPGRTASPRALKQQRNEARQGGAQPVRAYLTGTLEGHFQVNGRGNSTAEILSTLDGQAKVMLRDGTVSHLLTELAGLDVAEALGVFLRSDRPLPLRCARMDLQIQDGVVRPRLAVLDNADSTVRIEGQVNLRDETLNLRATTKPKDFSPLALRSPITVGGTLAAPKVGVDAKRLSGKVLGALALGIAVAPAAALLALVDRGGSDEADPCITPSDKPAAKAAAAVSPGPKSSAPPPKPAQGR